MANFVIDQVDADGTLLYILKKDPAREPMEFDILKLTLHCAGLGQPMNYQADLTNDTPPGVVHSTGSFGPWNFDEPASTRLAGRYAFDHADLSVFHGVSGILSSLGDFRGELNHITVDGRTDTPDFQLDRGAQQVHLTTQFHAVVDGTTGRHVSTTRECAFFEVQRGSQGRCCGHPPDARARPSLWTSMSRIQPGGSACVGARTNNPR
jgi:hypothetical protein